MNQLFCDLRTDEEKSNFFLTGRGYETGIIASVIQNDVAVAYRRCAEYAKKVQALKDALRELISIVEIHSSVTKNNFAWAELDEAKSAIAAAPKQFEKPMKNYHYQPIATGEKEAPFEIPEPPKSKEPTDSEMLDWLLEGSYTVLSFATGVLSRKYKVIDFHGDDVSVGDTAREAITKAMRGEE